MGPVPGANGNHQLKSTTVRGHQSGVIKVVVTSYLHFRSIPLELIPTEKTISFRKKENVNDDVNLLIQDLSYVHYPVIKTTLVDNG